MKTRTQTSGNPVKSPLRLGWLLLIPPLALTLPAQATGPEINIQSPDDTNAIISWHDPAGEYIVVWASTPDGPWTPCLESIDRGTNLCQMAVCTTGECKYFKLARGQRFEDDFNDGDLAGWNITYWDNRTPDYLDWGVTSGHLRVHGYWPVDPGSRMVCFHRTDLMLADFALSIDILAWDESHPEDVPNIVLLGRLYPSFVKPPNAYVYGGGAGMRYSGNPTNSCVWLWEHDGTFGDYLGSLQTFEKTDPAKDYRLQLDCVGTALTVKFFNLTDGILAFEYTESDDTYVNGWVGFYVVEHGPDGTVDFRLDNFVAVGTTP